MKKITIVLLAGLFVLSAFAVDPVITSFTVTANGDEAILEWESGKELNLVKYKIERSSDNQNFTPVHDVFPRGDNSRYRYVDENPLKFSSHRIFYYRIKMLFADGSYVYSETKSVSLSFSGLQETWGSIKAMFR